MVLTQNSGNKTPFTVGTPTVPTTLHKFTNMPWEIQDTIWDLSLPQRIAPACLPSKSKPCTSIGPIVHVCKRAKARALNSQTGWVNITVFDKVDNEGNLCPDAGPDKLAPLWFNGRRDLIYLEQGAAFNALGESDTFDDNELMQKVVADPSVGLLIDTHITLSIRDELELAWELLPDEQADDPDAVIQFAEKPAAQVLYEAIKMRQHIYLELFHIEVRLTGRRRDEVVRAGMFGQAGEDPAIIHAANFDEVQKYADLLETEKIKVHNGAYSRVPAELTNFLKERRWDWDVLGPQAPREFFVNLMETVLNYAGHGTLSPLSDDDDDDQDEDDDQELHTVQDEDGTPGDGDDTEESTWEVDELIDEDGRLVEERPLVEELDLVLPRCTSHCLQPPFPPSLSVSSRRRFR